MQWARAFGPSEQGWAGIIPNFSTAPAVNGEYPWSSVGITGAYHEPGARYLTLYRGTMFWRWDFWTNSWSASGQNGQINGTGAHYYEPGSYYHNHYIVHPWGMYDIYRSDDVLLTPNLYMQNLPLWQNAPQVMPGIVVESATYGGNCGAPANNQLGNLWANCAGKQTCLYRIEAAWIGDPAVGCAKTYEATYYCPGTDQRRSVWVPGEAGFGSVAALSCPYDP
jgi:hypothetical protein